MWKAAFAGAVALVIIDTSLALADSTDVTEQARPAQGLVLTQAHIAKFKSVLKLTAVQEQYWPAVEKAFREMTQRGSDIASSGLVQGISNRASSFGNNAMALRQLAVAAYPLIQSLDEGQKQNALALARTLGLEKLALAF
jgi:hypothetical protein